MNGKKILFAIWTLILLMICVSACQAANLPHTVGRELATEQTESKTETQKKSHSTADVRQLDSEKALEGETMTKAHIGEFDFENHTVLLNSGYTMPIMGLGTYALDHDTCVNSVKALLENGGRLIDTAYMYHSIRVSFAWKQCEDYKDMIFLPENCKNHVHSLSWKFHGRFFVFRPFV